MLLRFSFAVAWASFAMSKDPYSTFTPAHLGDPDLSATSGNPLKGFARGSHWGDPIPNYYFPWSVEFFNVEVR